MASSAEPNRPSGIRPFAGSASNSRYRRAVVVEPESAFRYADREFGMLAVHHFPCDAAENADQILLGLPVALDCLCGRGEHGAHVRADHVDRLDPMRPTALGDQIVACVKDSSARPRPAKLAAGGELRAQVEEKPGRRWSPEQVSARLKAEFPDRPEMRVSPETVYQSLYVQGRGALRRELAASLRTGRAVRRPRQAGRRGKIPGMVNISERPAEAADRAVPGHWEGDLIAGQAGKTHTGTLAGRSTRYTMLVPLPGGKSPGAFADAVVPVIAGLPDSLRRSLARDQGAEMNRHRQIAVAADVDVYFCDPHSPWQRGSNENTNGLLRRYFPKGTPLPADPQRLAEVAGELNGRPRKTLGWKTPAEALAGLLDGQAA